MKQSNQDNGLQPQNDGSVKWFIISVILTLLLLFIFVLEPKDWLESTKEELPDFSAIDTVKERKQAFFTYLKPLIESVNQSIIKDREKLDQWINEYQENKQPEESWWNPIFIMAKKYRIEDPKASPELLSELKKRIAPIPSSLVLAQAANESSWGRSRFAKEGNNLFGQWCFEPGCGIVPKNRPQGRDYEVADFDTPKESIESYMMNLNTFHAYEELRQIRANLRAEGKQVTGYELAAGLLNYSTRREEYVEEIRSMIRVNGLD